MNTAKLIKTIEQKTGMGNIPNQGVYKLDNPLKGHSYVLVSAVNTFDHGNETYIFGCTEEGYVINWSELPGSYIGGLDHSEALSQAGYNISKEGS